MTKSQKFEEKKFQIGELEGISAKSIEEHLKLYAGYVKHANLILEKVQELSKDTATNIYTIGELQRRFGFEFDGIRNHEYYFEQLMNGPKKLAAKSALGRKIAKTWGSVEVWQAQFKTLAMTRGIGWAVLYHDPMTDKLLHAWVSEQHNGHLTGLNFIYGLDMWEHSFMIDYIPGDKKEYVEAYIKNTNFDIVSSRFSA